ncbi:MAG: type I-C CRISPR-associated endonuclease Cas1 [Elusimicrobia bacterium]|nr:type I-C CRISPR-associated endonuclease Cas1 [Elusimicrobiota bacterium]
MEILQNTLYVMTQGAYLHRDHLTLKVDVEKETRLSVPIHHLESVAVFGSVMVSPGAMGMCAEAGIALTFLSESGRLCARVDAPQSGNVLLRREQFRKADRHEECARIARCMVAGKLQNARSLLLRGARQDAPSDAASALAAGAEEIGACIRRLETAPGLDAVRGHEGDGARLYFGAFTHLIRQQKEHFPFQGRNRRPPLDRVNALLSFVYALLLHDCVAALTAAGLDPHVGFLHADRPGRPSLALDLMEEFRPLAADRLVLAMINRREVQHDGFAFRDGGAVEMDERTRKAVVTAYQQRKREEVTHPLLQQKTTLGLLPFLQARLLARTIRGDVESYPACVLR